MTEETMTLTDFLLARIAEDAAAASPTVAEMNENSLNAGCQLGGPAIAYFPPEDLPKGAWSRFRVIAECEAKRAIVESESLNSQHWDIILRALAAVYAAHPDYRAEWA